MPSFLQRTMKSLYFDGSDDNVTIPIFPSVTGFTLAMWLNPRTVVNNNRILDWQDGGPGKGFTLIQQTNRNVNFQSHNGTSQTSNMSCGKYDPGRWNHLMITHNGTAVIAYINNVQIATDTSAAYIAAAATLTLGKRSGGANLFSGKIADFVYVDSRVISSAERTALYEDGTLPTGTSIAYDFDNDVVDVSGNGKDGTLTGGSFEIYRMPRSKIGIGSSKALNFANVAAANLTIPDAAALRPEESGNFTWFARIFITNLKENDLPRIVSKEPHFMCWMGNQTNARRNQLALEISDASGTVEFWGNTRLTPNRWYDVATTFSVATGEATHFINGIKEDMDTLLGPFDTSMDSSVGNGFLIGNSSGNNRNSGGMIKDVRAYNVVLTDNEIAQLTAGVDITRGLVGKWDCSEGTGTDVADSSGNGNNGTISGAVWQSIGLTRNTRI